MGPFDHLWVELALMLVLALALIALPLSILIALALIRLFRRRVAMSMRAAAGVPQHPEPLAGGGSEGVLDIEIIETKGAEERVPLLLGDARRRSRELAAIHAEAACIYPLVFVLLWWTPGDVDILRLPALFGFFVLVLATPAVLAGTMVFTKQPGLLALSACLLVAVLLAVDLATAADVRLVLFVLSAVPITVVLMLRMLRREPRLVMLTAIAMIILLLVAIPLWGRGSRSGTDLVGMWVMVAAVPTAAVVLLNTRRLRTVGPTVFAATLLLLYGIASPALPGSVLVDALDVRLVREDLAHLPLVDALSRLSLPERLTTVQAASRDFGSVFRYDAEKVTRWLEVLIGGLIAVCAVLGALAAWAVVRWLANTYQRRRASDQMLTIDVMMLIFVVPLSIVFTMLGENQLHGWLLGAIGLASFAGYKVWTRWRLRAWRQRRPAARPRTLLLLRVFGFDRRTQQLLEDVGQRWRYLGPIRLIGGVDLAYSTLEPHEFFDFLNGRLSRAFVKDRQDLEGRLMEGSPVPDPDGLYRVEEFFCHDHTWRMTVSRLAKDCDAILMDLRGFSPANQGCIFEIEQLIAGVPLDRVVLLADSSTDTAFLETTLRQAWRAMPGDSPNAGAGRHRVRIQKAGSRHRRTLKALLTHLCEDFPDSPGAAPSCPGAVRDGAVPA